MRRHHDFRLFWIGETTSQVGNSVTTVVVPLVAITTLHAGAFMVSLLTAAAWLPWLAIGLLAGAWIDRYPRRRRLMIVCDVISAALFASIPLARALGHLTDGQLLLVALGAGCSSVLFTTAYRAYLVDLVSDQDDRAAANSALQGSASAAQVSGPGLGGLLAQVLGAATALLADSVSFVVSAVCLAAVRAPAPARPQQPPEQSIRQRVTEGVRYLRHDPLLRPLLLFGGTANLALTGYQAILVVFLVRDVGLGAATVGVVLALTSCGGLLGAFIANPLARRIGSGRALLLTRAGATPFALLIPLAAPGARIGFFIAGGILVGVGLVAGNVISTGFVQSYTPADIYARTSATTNVFNYGTMPIGAILGGTLASTLGLHAALWITTALLPLSATILITSPLRRLRYLPTASSDSTRPATGDGVQTHDPRSGLPGPSPAISPDAPEPGELVVESRRGVS